ncbi:MAG TPA: hypothetical protein VLJ15_01050 [Gammaproteobacteria bacterium]|nr:hypothetical protein [Gammaproteobacteria bacterium]
MSVLKPFSTKDILLYLAGAFFGAKKPLNATIAEITIFYAKFGQQNDQWDALLDSNKSIEIPVRDLLDKLSTATTPLAKTAFTELSAKATTELKKSNDLENTADRIQTTGKKEQNLAMASLKTVWRAKNTDKQEHAVELKKAEALCTTSANALKTQIDNRASLNLELGDIAYRTYLALPNKNDLPRSADTPTMRQRLVGGSSSAGGG